jgi:hypothetical protein
MQPRPRHTLPKIHRIRCHVSAEYRNLAEAHILAAAKCDVVLFGLSSNLYVRPFVLRQIVRCQIEILEFS